MEEDNTVVYSYELYERGTGEVLKAFPSESGDEVFTFTLENGEEVQFSNESNNGELISDQYIARLIDTKMSPNGLKEVVFPGEESFGSLPEEPTLSEEE